jgi:cell division protein FtsA
VIGGPRVVAGLDVGSTKTCAVLVNAAAGWSDNGDGAEVLGVGIAATEGVRNRNVTNIEAATESIRDALRDAEAMAGLAVQGVYAGITGEHIELSCSTGIVAVAGHEISSSDVDQVHEVARAVVIPPDRELLHAIPQDYTVDGQRGIQDPKGMDATRLESEVFIVTAGSPACQNLRKAIDRAGFRVEELVLTSLASNVAVLRERDRQSGVAMVEIGGASTEALVFKDGRLRLVASLPWGAATVSNDIVKGLGIPRTEAESLKEQHGSARSESVDPSEKLEVAGPIPGSTREVSRELLAHIIEQRLDEIFGLVYEALEEKRLLETLPAGIVLTGGGAELDGVVELAQEVFNMPVALGAPGEGLAGVVDTVRGPKFAAGVGLALYGRHRERGRGTGLVLRALTRATDWLKDFF